MELAPFQVGECYENRAREYRVLEILDNGMMRVEYTDTGEIVELGIEMQRRIRRNMRIDAKVQKIRLARKRASGPSDRRGNKFSGLVDTDFSDDITGSTWRRKGTLAGLLARELSEESDRDFEHKTVYRSPEVYIYQDGSYVQKEKERSAKYLFRLDDDGAYYGFYISKSDRPMDDSWDWGRFLTALEEEQVQEAALLAMRQHNMTWRLWAGEEDEERQLIATIEPKITNLLWRTDEEETEIEWSEFKSRLEGLDADTWYDLYCFSELEKGSAIALGTSVSLVARDVFVSLLPLYSPCIIERE